MSRWRMKDAQFTDQQHERAHRFALSILMPDQVFAEAYQEHGGDVFELARVFKVTPSAVHDKIAQIHEEE